LKASIAALRVGAGIGGGATGFAGAARARPGLRVRASSRTRGAAGELAGGTGAAGGLAGGTGAAGDLAGGTAAPVDMASGTGAAGA